MIYKVTLTFNNQKDVGTQLCFFIWVWFEEKLQKTESNVVSGSVFHNTIYITPDFLFPHNCKPSTNEWVRVYFNELKQALSHVPLTMTYFVKQISHLSETGDVMPIVKKTCWNRFKCFVINDDVQIKWKRCLFFLTKLYMQNKPTFFTGP